MNTKLLKKILIPIACVVVIALLAVIIVMQTPPLYVMYLQHTGMVTGKVNSYEPKGATGVQQLSDQVELRTNIEYADEYPNSFMDIYLYDPQSGETHPTFFYLHGGGFAWGDKLEGDPTGVKPNAAGGTSYLQSVCEVGYNVVSINYALIPEYKYPTPLYQVDQAIHFLLNNADTYNLDMTHIVFAGGSAGGQLAGQYINVQTNPAYAEEMGMDQVLTNGEIVGAVLNCALLEPAGGIAMDTGSYIMDLMYNDLGKVYFSTDPEILEQANIISHMTENFPTAYITDGNTGTFFDQAEKLAQKLEAYGTPYEYNFYPEPELGHGYDGDLTNPYAQDNLSKTLVFLENLKNSING